MNTETGELSCVLMKHHQTGVIQPASLDGHPIVGSPGDLQAAFPTRYGIAPFAATPGAPHPIAVREWWADCMSTAARPQPFPTPN